MAATPSTPAASLGSTARRRSLPLAQAFRTFLHFPSPWLLAITLVSSVTARALVGSWSWVDVALPLTLVAVQPITEWVIHVFVLHFRPRQVGRVTVDLHLAKKHRAHHADPSQLALIFIPMRALVITLAVYAAAVFTVFPRVGLGLTFVATQSAIGLVYEWIHYLVHTDYRPRTRAYRAVWRNHRLHHYKNENYWMSVTTSGTSDRLFGTYPDPASVPTSPTARSLHSEVV